MMVRVKPERHRRSLYMGNSKLELKSGCVFVVKKKYSASLGDAKPFTHLQNRNSLKRGPVSLHKRGARIKSF